MSKSVSILLSDADSKAILEILRAAELSTEDGEPLVDFENRNRDARDFTNVSRSTLRSMLVAAFRAGQSRSGGRP